MSDTFGYEVDFLAVGNSSKSGDAICIRWGEELSSRRDCQFVMVVDGGFSYSADDVVAHIKKHYYGDENQTKEKTVIDVLISTHPHSDHFGGIPGIYEKATVREVAMHTPWTHVGLPRWFKDGRVTTTGIKSRLKDGLEAAYSFAQKLKQKGTPPVELYAGESYTLPYGVRLNVWGPSKEFYDRLLPDFNVTPTNGNGVGDDRLILTGKDVPAAQGRLSDVGDTSAENLSGIIFTLTMPSGEVLLFTGDAGIDSLLPAIHRMYKQGVDLSRLTFFHVPHHGSVQNLCPTLLKLLFGPEEHPLQPKKVSAYISVAKSPDNSHPSRRVINALNKYNCKVYKTEGSSLQHYRGSATLHMGWSSVEPLKNYDMVEG